MGRPNLTREIKLSVNGDRENSTFSVYLTRPGAEDWPSLLNVMTTHTHTLLTESASFNVALLKVPHPKGDR